MESLVEWTFAHFPASLRDRIEAHNLLFKPVPFCQQFEQIAALQWRLVEDRRRASHATIWIMWFFTFMWLVCLAGVLFLPGFAFQRPEGILVALAGPFAIGYVAVTASYQRSIRVTFFDLKRQRVTMYSGFKHHRMWKRGDWTLSSLRLERRPLRATVLQLGRDGPGWNQQLQGLFLLIDRHAIVLACQRDAESAIASMPRWVQTLPLTDGPEVRARADKRLIG